MPHHYFTVTRMKLGQLTRFLLYILALFRIAARNLNFVFLIRCLQTDIIRIILWWTHGILIHNAIFYFNQGDCTLGNIVIWLQMEIISHHGVFICLSPFICTLNPRELIPIWSFCQLEHYYICLPDWKLRNLRFFWTSICILIDIYTTYLLRYVYNVQLTFLCCHFQLVHSSEEPPLFQEKFQQHERGKEKGQYISACLHEQINCLQVPYQLFGNNGL